MVGLTRADAHFHELSLAAIANDRGELPYFRAYHREPLRVPTYARLLRQSLAEQATQLGPLSEMAAGLLREGTRRQALGDVLEPRQQAATEAGALARAIEGLHADAHAPLSSARANALRTGVRAVPSAVQAAAAFLLEVSRPTIRAYRTAIEALGPLNSRTVNAVVRSIAWDLERAKLDLVPVPREVESALARFDFKRAFAPSLDLAEAARRAESELRSQTLQQSFRFDWDTPYGRISLRGAQDDHYAGDLSYLLIIDTGGNEVFQGGASAFGPENPVSLLLDVRGNDRYLGAPELAQKTVAEWSARAQNTARPSFGAGVFGTAILIDSQGNDLYRAGSDSLGRAIFGLGVLDDREGDDTYDCFANCEAAADFGVALLMDEGGRDRYDTFTQAQGFGGPHGVGILLDAGPGSDEYTANDSVRDLPFKRGTEHNVSIAQGAGVGWRGDATDGHSLAGGIGILWDGGGDNRYRAGIHAQGFGYWHGIGILSAGPGRDDYLGDYYAQGTSAHYAVGVLHDEGGDDHYRALEYQAMGQGRDVSVGVLIDESGNDVYEAPALSLGFGDYHSFGLFWDRGGDDRYVSVSADVLGGVRDEGLAKSSLISLQPTVGLFLDSGGRDQYSVGRAAAGDGKHWEFRLTHSVREFFGARGAGADVEAPDLLAP